jgi:hypothetical protein
MTWIRAYENYTNVVLAKHGEYGGSFAWTPRRGKAQRNHAAEWQWLYLIADVKLPVDDLIEDQRHKER